MFHWYTWFLVGHVAAIGCGLYACSSTPPANSSPRETARAAVILFAKTTAIADEACATLAKTKQDVSIAKTCADAYDIARPALLAAEAGVDAWESGSKNEVACAVAKASNALTKIAETVKAGGGTLPLSVIDSLKFATSIVGECPGSRRD